MKNAIALRDRIIVALDVPDAGLAMEHVNRLKEAAGFFKVGLQLFLAEGFSIVDRIGELGLKVMLDLKLHDIPKTVELAVEQFRGHGVALATVHGYAPTVRAAALAKRETKLLAVTVLTSMGPGDLAEAGYAGEVDELVLRRARTSMREGADGVVCSGLEAGRLRRALGPDALIVTPGIRQAGPAGDDQTRIVTAGAAIAAGADHVVAGRPILGAADPLGAARAMIEDVARALETAGR